MATAKAAGQVSVSNLNQRSAVSGFQIVRYCQNTMGIQGVIRPPPEIRAVADRTALYVAKNGRAFETRILSSAKGKTPKFAFLHSTSPFHAYYEQQVDFYENGGEDDKKEEKDKENDGIEKKDETLKKNAEEKLKLEKTQKKASSIDPVAKALLKQRAKIAKFQSEGIEPSIESKHDPGDDETNTKPAANIEAPPPPQFVNIVAPSYLSIAQIETIQLVAQFTALDGKGGAFLSQLTLREWNNPTFAFCQPRNGHFAYFSALVDAYRRVLELWTGSAAPDGVKEMADNTDNCLERMAYRAEYERYLEEKSRKEDGGATFGAFQVDWNDFVVVETIDFPVDEAVELSMLPPPPSTPKTNLATGDSVKQHDEMDESGGQDEEQIRVVPSYTPNIVSAQSKGVEMAIDPITGKSVPLKDMPEHMRIQLMDPKWAEERKKFQEKQKDSNLVGGDVVASNIAQFAQARGDMFGKTLSKETDSKKRLAEANRIIREQAQNKTTLGPSLPKHPAGPAHPPPMQNSDNGLEPSIEPAVKRPRIETTHITAPLPSPSEMAVPPPAGFSGEGSSAKEDSFAEPAAASTNSTMSEADFAASLSKPEVTLQIRIPNDPAQTAWNFFGQIVSLSIDVMSSIKSVKQEMSRTHLNNMPTNKIQLKSTADGKFLKDALTLATLNIGPTATLELIPKTRGGRK